MPFRRKKDLYRLSAALLALALPISVLAAASPGASASPAMPHSSTSSVTSSSLGNFTPTFVGPAATGCASGCDLLTGPFVSPSTAGFALGSAKANAAAKAAKADLALRNAAAAKLAASGNTSALTHTLPSPMVAKDGPDPAPPTVNCPGSGCEQISMNAGGAKGVKGINAVDSGTLSTNPLGDIEPSDQGLCAGNGFVVESDNIGEVLIFNTRLDRVSSVIPLDTLMGLTAKGWSSGGDIMCQYDYSNGGHFIFTEFASASTEASGGPFSGCFAGVANTCFEAIAVTKGNSPFGPYNVYFLNANYNPAEPGAPFLLNDFTKTAVTRDAFELFYDEFPLVNPGIGGGGFNGAQEFAFDKTALELGLPVTLGNGNPNPFFNVAIENMGLLATPDGTCASDNVRHRPGITCWFSVIPTMPPDPSQYDNSHLGSGFMLDTLDFHGQGDTRIAAFDWTGLAALNSVACFACGLVHFGGQLFSGVNFYFGEGVGATQKAGPIPLGDECGAAGLSTGTTPPASCPEGPIATNGDNFTQGSQSQGQLWGAISTEIDQLFPGSATPEVHQGGAFWEIGTKSFDRSGVFTLTSQGYLSAAHEDLAFPDIAAPDHGPAALFFTLTGNGGPTGADNGGFFPSTAFGRLMLGSSDLQGLKANVVDLGQSPEDGFGEYQGFPGPISPRWGDYSAGVYDAATNKIFFSTQYIQFPNCAPPDFTLTLATCGGTRDDFANWGTSVNSVTP